MSFQAKIIRYSASPDDGPDDRNLLVDLIHSGPADVLQVSGEDRSHHRLNPFTDCLAGSEVTRLY